MISLILIIILFLGLILFYLQPTELAAATGFPSNYKFTGSKVEVVKQIGNAVPPNFAKALFTTMLKEQKKQEKEHTDSENDESDISDFDDVFEGDE